MTEKANPSINRPAEAFKTAGAIAYGGHGGDGFVVDGANPTDIAVQDGGITEADLNAFAETSGGASLDVTIDGGEAFVFGSWLAIDTDTVVSLAASTAGQTVYVGWNKNGADDVIVGLDGAFSGATGDTDERIPLWTFDTDGTGVTNVVDERRIGYTQEATTFTGAIDLDANTITGIGSSEWTDSDGTVEFSSFTQAGDWILQDEVNDVDKIRVNQGGTVDILDTSLNFNGASSIQVQGLNAISIDAGQAVTIPNGDLNMAGNQLNSVNGVNHDGIESYAFDSGGPVIYSNDGAGNDIPFIIFRNNGTESVQINPGGGNVTLDLSGTSQVALPQVSSDPTASAGDMWYRTDLD